MSEKFSYDRMRVVALVPAIQRAIKAVRVCRYCPGTAAKRFAQNVQAMKGLTPGQELFLWQLVWTHRRQMPDGPLVAFARQKIEKLKAKSSQPAQPIAEPQRAGNDTRIERT